MTTWMDEALKLKSGMMPKTKNDWTNRAAKKNALVRATCPETGTASNARIYIFIYLRRYVHINNLERRMKNIKCKNR